ncbi:hypothetical protein D3C86_1600750 [compost metagenome]
MNSLLAAFLPTSLPAQKTSKKRRVGIPIMIRISVAPNFSMIVIFSAKLNQILNFKTDLVANASNGEETVCWCLPLKNSFLFD